MIIGVHAIRANPPSKEARTGVSGAFRKKAAIRAETAADRIAAKTMCFRWLKSSGLL